MNDIRVLINDGQRALRNTGYGQLARVLTEAVGKISGMEPVLSGQIAPDNGIDISRIDQYIRSDASVHELNATCDIVLNVSPPAKRPYADKPVYIYTQHALSDLPDDWAAFVSQYDGVFVPGRFDQRVFRQYNERTWCCPQAVENRRYSPVAKYRCEGDEKFTVMFVGSFSYRKGADILLETLARFGDEKAAEQHSGLHVILACPTGLENTNGLTKLINGVRTLPDTVSMEVIPSSLSPAWMHRYYNRSDALICMSRGEGWCMPVHESLLCGKPVIVPDSTSMGENLPIDGVIRLPVRELAIDGIADPFGMSLKNRYGGTGRCMYEASADDAVDALLELSSNYGEYSAGALRARRYILDKYNVDTVADHLRRAFESDGLIATAKTDSQIEMSA